jgi:hypothetical protein
MTESYLYVAEFVVFCANRDTRGGNANVVVFIDCKDNKLKRNEQW